MPEDPDFATALRETITTSGLSLHQLVHRLGERGVAVTAATLSTWQTGRTHPARRSSVRVVTELEHVLGLPTGELLRHTELARRTDPAPPHLHPPTSPLGRWIAQVRDDWQLPGAEAFSRDLALARVTVARRVWRTYGYEHQLRCEQAGADRLLLSATRHLFSVGLAVPELRAVAGCELGRARTGDVDGLGVKAIEVLLPRPLTLGESWRIAVQSTEPEESDSHRHLVHAAPAVGLTIGQVVFADETPRQVRRTLGRVEDGQSRAEEPGPWEQVAGRSVTGVLTAQDLGRSVELSWQW